MTKQQRRRLGNATVTQEGSIGQPSVERSFPPMIYDRDVHIGKSLESEATAIHARHRTNASSGRVSHMSNLLHRFSTTLLQWLESRGIRERRRHVTGDERGPRPPLSPLTAVNCGLRDVADILGQQLAATHRLLDQVASLEAEAADAWQEQTSLVHQYYGVIRGLLEVLDDCSENSDGEVLETVRAKLERVLRDQDILPIVVAENSPFEAELHCCEETIESPGQPGGTVIRVLESGYLQRQKDGTTVVIRPARVVATKTDQSKEMDSDAIGP